MAYIYKIINQLNNKIYIGKTSLPSIEERFKQHKNDYKKRRSEKRPLYRAMNLYGIENFTIELVEECSNEELEQKEKYWISFYDSYKNGYNATLGGDGSFLYNHQEIIDLLKNNKTTKEIANILGCSLDLIYNVAQANNIDLKAINLKNIGKSVYQYDKQGKIIQSFDTLKEAATWCVNNNLTQGDVSTARKRIGECVANKRKTIYGYIWKEKSL